MLKNKEKIKEIIKRSNQFIVICGPSGSGKTMTIKHLVDNYGFIEPPFITTRELRSGEKEMGSICVSRDEFMEKNMDGQIFLSARSYGNAYGYDLDIIFSSIIKGKKIVIEAPSSNLMTDVSYFLPQSTIMGIVPLTIKEIDSQLNQRALNNGDDQRIRLLNCEIEKEHIAYCCGLIDITPILPTYGNLKNTLRQVDRLMEKKGFKKNK
ncbi:MAG: hypothetical protein Q8N28_01325 [bacterium]|nr:hypothetical protein [bacterium]